jgi:hypothetical protein
MSIKKWEEGMNKKAISFMKKFIIAVTRKRFQVVRFGWWSTGDKGRYGLSLFWENLDETE